MILDERPWSDPLGGLKGWGQKLKIQLLQNMVMLHIKLKGIKNAATWKQIFLPTEPPPPGVGSIGQNSTFSEQCHVAYQIK